MASPDPNFIISAEEYSPDRPAKYGENTTSTFSARTLIEFVVLETANAQNKIDAVKPAGSAISIADMFEMQQRMNRLSQISEMCSAVVGAASGAISSMARAVK